MVRFTVDNRNRLIFYGNPVGYVKDDAAVVDEMFRTDELNQYLSRMNLTPRWEDGIFDRLVSGEVTGEEPVQPRKGCRIWQLKKDVDVAMRFIGYEDQVRKFGEPDAGNYTLVFDGDLGTSDLEQILYHLPGRSASRLSGLPNGAVGCGGAVRRFRQRILLLRPGRLSADPIQAGAGPMHRYDLMSRTGDNRPAFSPSAQGRGPPATRK